jgi:hypothetical protein
VRTWPWGASAPGAQAQHRAAQREPPGRTHAPGFNVLLSCSATISVDAKRDLRREAPVPLNHSHLCARSTPAQREETQGRSGHTVHAKSGATSRPRGGAETHCVEALEALAMRGPSRAAALRRSIVESKENFTLLHELAKTPINTSLSTSTNLEPGRYDVRETVSPCIQAAYHCARTHDTELMRLTLLRSTHLVSLALCAQAFSPSSAAPLGLRLRGAGLSG